MLWILLMSDSSAKLYDGFQVEQELGSNYYYRFQSLSREISIKSNIERKFYKKQELMQNNKQLYKPYCSKKWDGQPIRQSVVDTNSSMSSTEPDTWCLCLEFLLTLKPEMLSIYSKKTKQNLPICKRNFKISMSLLT